MANYKIIFKLQKPEIPWEPGCPIMLTALQVSRNSETSEAWFQVKALNVSDSFIGSIFGELKIGYSDGTEENLTVEYLDADIEAGNELALKPHKLPRGDVKSCALSVSRAEGQTQSWASSSEPTPIPSRKELALSPRAAEQKARNLGTMPTDLAVLGKVQNHDNWWVCACGEINVQRDTCYACGKSKDLLLDNEDEEVLLTQADKHDDELFSEAVKLQEQETCSSLTDAIATFEYLGDYEEAGDHISECEAKLATIKFSEAVKLQEQGTRSSLTEAIEKFKSLGDYEEAGDHISECEAKLATIKFSEAVKLQEQGTRSSLTEAIEKFKSLGDYEEAGDHISECEAKLATIKKRRTKIGILAAASCVAALIIAFVLSAFSPQSRADGLYKDGSYAKALKLYQSVNDNDQYADKISNCRYQLFLSYLLKGAYTYNNKRENPGDYDYASSSEDDYTVTVKGSPNGDITCIYIDHYKFYYGSEYSYHQKTATWTLTIHLDKTDAALSASAYSSKSGYVEFSERGSGKLKLSSYTYDTKPTYDDYSTDCNTTFDSIIKGDYADADIAKMIKEGLAPALEASGTGATLADLGFTNLSES